MPRKRQIAATRLDDARARMYRDLILEAAECVFGEKGFDRATMQEIASEAGVSLKTVYSSFPGKNEIYLEILKRRGRAMTDAVIAAQRAIDSPVEKLERGTRALVHFLFEHPDWLRVYSQSIGSPNGRTQSCGSEGHASEPVRPRGTTAPAFSEDELDVCIETIREGIACGEFCDEDPAELAVLVQALTKVHVAQARDAADGDANRVADRLVKRLLRLVCMPTDAVPHAVQEIEEQETG